jgi:hypothetical protein
VGLEEGSLSVIATDLPSKKSFARIGTLPGMMKTRRSIDSTAVPAQNCRRLQSAAAFRLHPKFTTHRAKWAD